MLVAHFLHVVELASFKHLPTPLVTTRRLLLLLDPVQRLRRIALTSVCVWNGAPTREWFGGLREERAAPAQRHTDATL
jgi:hypothetical protein